MYAGNKHERDNKGLFMRHTERVHTYVDAWFYPYTIRMTRAIAVVTFVQLMGGYFMLQIITLYI